jgi:hypothetical protein
MNYKLILALSGFGLAMGIATVYVIPSNVEPICWLVIFVICAVLIARFAPGQPFLHGVLVGLANSVWITGAHVILYEPYAAYHAQELQMMQGAPFPPRAMMLLVGPVIGLISGVVLGLFSVVASKLVKRAQVAPAA